MYRVERAESRQPSPRTGARIGEMVHERSSRWRTPDIRWHVRHVWDAAVRRAQFEHIRLLEQTVWSTCRQRWEQAGVQRLRTGKATALLAKAVLLLTSLRSDLVTDRRLSMGPSRVIIQMKPRFSPSLFAREAPEIFQHEEKTNRLKLSAGAAHPWMRHDCPEGAADVWAYCAGFSRIWLAPR